MLLHARSFNRRTAMLELERIPLPCKNYNVYAYQQDLDCT
jgi:hypothetical protein